MPRLAPSLPATVTPTWHRQTGLFWAETAAGTVIGASANHWDEYLDQLANLPRTTAGYVVSPELIATPDARPNPDLSEARLDTVASLSRALPWATLLVGAPEHSRLGTYNALWLVSRGLRRVLMRKQLLTPPEQPDFQAAAAPTLPPQPGIQAVICLDAALYAFGVRTPAADTTTMVMSSCWATPLHPQLPNSLDNEARYNQSLQEVLARIMAGHALRDLVVVDRTPPDGDTAPFNCHMHRQATTT